MNLLTYARDLIAYIPAKIAYERGFYEGGKVTNANKDFWNTNASFEDNASMDRDRLRARARWLSGNNAIMDNIDNAIINNVIGNGIGLQSITGKSTFDDAVEEKFKIWAKTPSVCDSTGRFTFSDMQRVILKSRMVDGEIFIYKRVTREGLQLQLIEADSLDGGRQDKGIETDTAGRPIKYHFLTSDNKKFIVKAEYIINYFQVERPTQYRGISEYKQAILDLKNFSAFQTASIQGARARANIAYVMENDGKPDPLGGNLKDKIHEVNGVSVLYVNKGEKLSKLDPDSVATDYIQFSENTIRLIATARKVSYELAFRDYSKVNFASSRASLLQDFKRFDQEQTHLMDYVLNDIFKTWLQTEIYRGEIKAHGYDKTPSKFEKPKWIMPKRDLVDPLKEITAIEKKIAMGITCETDVANQNGEDYEEILKKKAKEIELKKKYGVPDYSLIETDSDDDEDDDDYDEQLSGGESANDKKEKREMTKPNKKFKLRGQKRNREAETDIPPFSKREALKGTTQTRSVSVRVGKADDLPANTVSFVFVSDDNAGVRYDWGSGEHYIEVLDVNGATTSRLNTFFKNHNRDVDSAVGKVSNTRVVDGQLIGDVTFGTDERSQELFTKYSEGILTDVSVGYEIRDYEVKQGAENERDTVTVTDFDVFEVSAVGIGFDSGAKKRSDDNLGSPTMNEEELKRFKALTAMVERTADQTAELVKLQNKRDVEDKKASDLERQKLIDENNNLKRQADVAVLCNTHKIPTAERTAWLANVSVTADYARSLILDMKSKETPVVIGKQDTNERGSMIDAMVDGLALRVGAKIENPHADAEKYRYASLIAIGNALLPENERSFDPSSVAERSLVSGDFPLLLQSVGARVLTAEFEAQTGTFKAWMKEVDVPDFRVMTELTSSIGGGRLDKTLENGDLKELSGNEKAESWKIESYGNKFVLTRQMIINDDLGNFTNLIQTFSRMAMTTVNGLSYDLLQSTTYKMADGSGLYVASRNNASTSALSSEALSAGRLAMSKHTSIDGKTPLNIVPKYLIVSPALEVTAKEILGALSKVGADNTNVPNVNQNAYVLIVDPEINSDTAWYLLADYRTLKMGYLAGTNRSPVTKMNDSTITRTTYEGVFDVGVMVEDYRGLYRGNV